MTTHTLETYSLESIFSQFEVSLFDESFDYEYGSIRTTEPAISVEVFPDTISFLLTSNDPYLDNKTLLFLFQDDIPKTYTKHTIRAAITFKPIATVEPRAKGLYVTLSLDLQSIHINIK